MSQYELSDQLVANVKDAEGVFCKAYRDSLGFWTVGAGHKLATGKDWTGYTILPDTANALLLVDLNTAAREAIGLPEWPCLDTQARQDSLVELVFNMGVDTWRKFPATRAAISDKAWQTVYNGLLRSLWATQVGSTRSTRIATQFLYGGY